MTSNVCANFCVNRAIDVRDLKGGLIQPPPRPQNTQKSPAWLGLKRHGHHARLRKKRVDYQAQFARNAAIETVEQVGNMNCAVRTMAASTYSIVSLTASEQRDYL